MIVVWLQGGASHRRPTTRSPSAGRGGAGPWRDRDPGGGRADQRAAADARGRRRQVRDPAIAGHTGFPPSTGEPADVHGSSGAGAQAPARAPRPDVHRRTGCGRIRAGGCRPMWASTRSPTWARPTSAPRRAVRRLWRPERANFRVAELGLREPSEVRPHRPRASLAAQFDHFRRALDDRARSETFDAFHQQAFTLLTGPETRRAFDLGREDPRLRDRYGRNTWGQRCLLAR